MDGKVEQLIEISRCHRERQEKRRSYEWKFFFSLWSALVGFAIALGTEKVRISPACLPWFWVFGIVVVAAALVFGYGVHKLNRKDSDLAWFYLDSSSFLTIGEPKRTVLPENFESSAVDDGLMNQVRSLQSDKVGLFARIPQILFTAVFAALVIFLAHAAAESKSPQQGQILKVEYSSTQPSKSIKGEISNP